MSLLRAVRVAVLCENLSEFRHARSRYSSQLPEGLTRHFDTDC